MKGALIGALVLSVLLNVWLLATRTAGEPATERPAATDAAVAPAEARRRRVAVADAIAGGADETETVAEESRAALERVKELQSDVDSLEPQAWLLYSSRPIGWKVRRILEIEDERERSMAAWELGKKLGENEESAAMLLAALKEEADADVIGVIGQMLRAGAMTKAPTGVRREFVSMLKTHADPNVRAAAARAVFMSEAFRGGFSGDAKAIAKEMNSALVEAIRAETAPEVVGVIANAMAAWHPTPDAVDALRDAAQRLPPSDGRRETWKAIARGTFMGDRGKSLFDTFDAATDQTVRDDIAAGIARAANSMSGMMGGDPEEAEQRMQDARTRLFDVYALTTDKDVRRDLARGTMHGLGCIPPFATTEEAKADASHFFRELAAMEPDAEQQKRLERFAGAIEADGFRGSNQWREIMYAGE